MKKDKIKLEPLPQLSKKEALKKAKAIIKKAERKNGKTRV